IPIIVVILSSLSVRIGSRRCWASADERTSLGRPSPAVFEPQSAGLGVARPSVREEGAHASTIDSAGRVRRSAPRAWTARSLAGDSSAQALGRPQSITVLHGAGRAARADRRYVLRELFVSRQPRLGRAPRVAQAELRNARRRGFEPT